MRGATALSSDMLRAMRWPGVFISAVAGLTPHILLLNSPAATRLTVIVVIHAVLVPVFTWFALTRLEIRARRLEVANDELRQTAEDLSRRNSQIDALNSAFRLLSGTPSIGSILEPLCGLVRQVAQATSASILWDEEDAEPIETRTEPPDVRVPEDAIQSTRIELTDAGKHLGWLVLAFAGEDEFTRKSLSVLVSEIELRWRLIRVEGNALLALTGTAGDDPELDGDRQTRRLLSAISEAVQARGACFYVLRGGVWQSRATYGEFEDADVLPPPAERTIWQNEDAGVLYLKSADDGILALNGVSDGRRATKMLNLPLLQIVAGHSATLLRVVDTYREKLWAERQRIARELHDDVCQSLASLHMQLGHLADLIESGRTDAAIGRSRELRADALNAYDATRRAVDEFRQKPGVGETASDFLKRIAQAVCDRQGVAIKTSLENVRLNAETAWQLGRIVQEGINNAIRHGGADAIAVTLDEIGDQVRLEVQDDGTGFDDDRNDVESARTSHGVSIMNERVADLGGQLKLAREGELTTLLVHIPAHAI